MPPGARRRSENLLRTRSAQQVPEGARCCIKLLRPKQQLHFFRAARPPATIVHDFGPRAEDGTSPAPDLLALALPSMHQQSVSVDSKCCVAGQLIHELIHGRCKQLLMAAGSEYRCLCGLPSCAATRGPNALESSLHAQQAWLNAPPALMEEDHALRRVNAPRFLTSPRPGGMLAPGPS